MTDPIAFTLAVLALLAAPGPTNTLLATSGAAAGLTRSLHLLLAAMGGYLIATLALALVIGPLVNVSHLLDIALRIACGLYLLYAAWRLWREGAAAIASDEPVKFRRVLVATSLNPKAIVFAFVIVPFLSPLRVESAPYLAAMAAMTALVCGGWMALGAALRRGAAFDSNFARRAGAAVLCLFAVLISGSAFSA